MNNSSIKVSGSLSAILLLTAFPAGAAFTIQSRYDAGADTHYIKPYIRVHSDSNANLKDYTISYYLYEATQPVVFNAPTTTTPGVAISVARLPRTITGYQAPSDADGLNANYVVQIKVTADTPIAANGNFDIQFSLQASDNRSFVQTDDWSYLYNTGYVNNGNITLAKGTNGTGTAPTVHPETVLKKAREKLKHIVIIMQENRSFDNYFGTYPGADGVLGLAPVTNYSGAGSCTLPSPGTYAPNPTPITANEGDYPHFYDDAIAVLDVFGSGILPMKNFLDKAAPGHCTDKAMKEVVGYHDARDIPSYWKFAQNFVLQDKLFESAPSYSKISHLFMVSGWSGDCDAAYTCTENIANVEVVPGPFPAGSYLWNDITNLLNAHSVTWKYYWGENWNPTCTACSSNPKACVNQTQYQDVLADFSVTRQFWSPISDFETVKTNGQTGNIVNDGLQGNGSNTGFYDDALPGLESLFPSVSWIIPGPKASEHAGMFLSGTDIRAGHSYVTSLVQAIMRNTALWESTAIFVSWDDWGGFYDHVRPPLIDNRIAEQGYGLRVPGLTISPWVQQAGYIDSQVLSHDAYLKLIEDVFLNKERIEPLHTGEARITPLREDVSQLGDLLNEFDFFRTPISTPPTDVTTLPCDTATNAAPFVHAGDDVSIALPAQAALSGQAIDDRSTTLNYAWSKLIGPSASTVTFNPSNGTCTVGTSCKTITANAAFSAAGVYVLRLTATDGAGLLSSDDVQITVTPGGSSGTRPCDGLCSNPTIFSLPGSTGTNYQSHDLGTAEVCRETTSVVNGGNCGNFTGGRTLKVNGVQKVCTYSPWLIQPTPRNGGYCIHVSPGNYSYATFTLWN